MSADYAWIVDTDHLFENGSADAPNDAGTTGPRDADPGLLAALVSGLPGGAEVDGITVQNFRMYDDDGALYYTGRYLGPDDDGMFGPLDDFGKPNAGCTDIHYYDAFTGKSFAL